MLLPYLAIQTVESYLLTPLTQEQAISLRGAGFVGDNVVGRGGTDQKDRGFVLLEEGLGTNGNMAQQPLFILPEFRGQEVEEGVGDIFEGVRAGSRF